MPKVSRRYEKKKVVLKIWNDATGLFEAENDGLESREVALQYLERCRELGQFGLASPCTVANGGTQ